MSVQSIGVRATIGGYMTQQNASRRTRNQITRLARTADILFTHMPPAHLDKVRVYMTVFGGSIIYQRNDRRMIGHI